MHGLSLGPFAPGIPTSAAGSELTIAFGFDLAVCAAWRLFLVVLPNRNGIMIAR